MELLHKFADLLLHLDKHLGAVIEQYGTWTYLILFAIIFCETGLVVTPILPGDSLLFLAGAFAARGSLDATTLIVLLAVAAIAGDAVNYSIGHYLGPKVLGRDGRFLKKKYLDRTHQFFERYGGKTIILARFVPIVRTFAPFMAGVGTMSYLRFASYNVVGAVVWVAAFILGGYYFSKFPWVEDHFTLVEVAIILISVTPALYEAWLVRREAKAAGAGPPAAGGEEK